MTFQDTISFLRRKCQAFKKTTTQRYMPIRATVMIPASFDWTIYETGSMMGLIK